MEINVDDKSRIVDIWLTNAEKNNTSVRQELRKLCGEYKARKYKTAIFLSGEQDLVECTLNLLLHNRYPQSPSR